MHATLPASAECIEDPVLPAEQVRGATAWQLPDFQAAKSAPPTAARLAEIERVAYQEGFQQGQVDGFSAGQKAALEQAQRLAAVAEALAKPLDRLDDEVERALVALATAVARRVIGEALQSEPAHVLDMIRETLALLPPRLRRIHVHLHPLDAELVGSQLQAPPDAQDFAVVRDAGLQRGDVRVTTESTLIDARLDSRVQRVAEALCAGCVLGAGT